MAMTQIELQDKIEQKLNAELVVARDLTGTSDHWQVTVVSPLFEGKSMVDQHRMVKGVFENEIKSNEVHALSLKTYTPAEWAKKSS